MKLSNVMRTAALMAATVSVNVQAGELPVIKGKPAPNAPLRQCIPIVSYAGDASTMIQLCDATAINKVVGAKLGADGCAIEQESNYADSGTIFKQGYNEQYVNAGEAPLKLRECDIDDIGSWMVEL